MVLTTGTKLGPYEIAGSIGSGGMGEVYRARDSKLNRDVAVKVLPYALAGDAERMARFQREAQVLASLNHPNIASIYGLEESGGVRALVMELVEGPTLAERIETGPIPLEESLAIAKQMAEALEYAHEKGIMHRDLKPANVKMTAEGVVKVLDFGLARAAEETAASTNPANSPTLTLAATQAGVILGTAAYMAPEQARGQTVDKRADIWAFGVVLYEMLAGKRMFGGETVSDTLAAVLTRDPEWDRLPAGIPGTIRRLLRRCLDRDKKKRLQSVGDARIEIEEYLADPAGTSALTDGAVTSQPARHHLLPWVAAAVFAVIALALALLHFREVPADARLMKLSILPPEKTSLGSIAISPDGRWLAFTAATGGNDQLWIRALDALKAQVMAGTEGASYPFWSPDSRSIGFFTNSKLKKVEASGGLVQTVCDVSGASSGGTWNRDGVIVFATTFGLNRVPAKGGAATLVPALSSQEFHWFPSFLPDGDHVFDCIRSARKETRGIYLGSLDGKVKQRLLGDDSNAVYVPSLSSDKQVGYLLFLREGALLAQPFDARQLKLTGEPFSIAERVGRDPSFFHGSFSVSDNGVLVYDSSLNRQSKQLVWVDRQGKLIRSLGAVGGFSQPWLSPDERRVAVDRYDSQTDTYDLWLHDATGGAPARFTFDSANDRSPVWSPDGSRIIWRSDRDATFGLYSKASSGAGPDELLLKSDNPQVPTDWSLDGRFLIYYEIDPKTKRDIWVLPLSGDKKPFPFLQAESNEAAGQFSPDGRWMAYASDQTGAYEVYVRSFPSGGGQWQVSAKGGTGPRWRRDGRELFYYALDGKLMAAEVKNGASFGTGVPHPLFEFRSGASLSSPYAVTPDGQRFLLNTVVDESGGAPLTVVINWLAELKR